MDVLYKRNKNRGIQYEKEEDITGNRKEKIRKEFNITIKL